MKLNVVQKYKSSGKELTKPLSLTVSAMLLALSIVLGYFANLSINFLGTNVIKIGFNVVPIVIVAMLYGPVPASIVGACSDIIGYMLAPKGAYIPGFTISMILVGTIYGLSFYKEKLTLPRVIITELIVSVFINIILGVTWFVFFYGVPFSRALTIRGLKELFDIPLSIILYYSAYKLLMRIPETKRILKIEN